MCKKRLNYIFFTDFWENSITKSQELLCFQVFSNSEELFVILRNKCLNSNFDPKMLSLALYVVLRYFKCQEAKKGEFCLLRIMRNKSQFS